MVGKEILQQFGRSVSRNLPTILTGLTGAGVFVTAAMGVAATPKALMLLDEEVCKRYEDEDLYNLDITERIGLLEKKDIVKITWKIYIPTIAMGLITTACAFSANRIQQRRFLALAGVYSLTEATFKEYQRKVVKTLGSKKAKEIKEEIYRDKLEENPTVSKEITITGKGNTLCYETISGRYFMSDIESVRKAQNELNHNFLKDVFLPLNEIYYALGLSDVKMGNDMGWDLSNGLLEFDFSSQLTQDGTPCLVIDYCDEPIYNFRTY